MLCLSSLWNSFSPSCSYIWQTGCCIYARSINGFWLVEHPQTSYCIVESTNVLLSLWNIKEPYRPMEDEVRVTGKSASNIISVAHMSTLDTSQGQVVIFKLLSSTERELISCVGVAIARACIDRVCGCLNREISKSIWIRILKTNDLQILNMEYFLISKQWKKKGLFSSCHIVLHVMKFVTGRPVNWGTCKWETTAFSYLTPPDNDTNETRKQHITRYI